MIATDFAENETDRDPFAVRPPGQDNGDNRTTPMPDSRRNEDEGLRSTFPLFRVAQP